VLAIRLYTHRIKRKSVVLKLKTTFNGNMLLALLDLRIVKLFNMTTGHADQMIVMATLLKLENRLACLKMAAR